MDWREDSKGFRRGLKNHQTTADLVSNNSPLLVFYRYQIKCKSVSNNSPRYIKQLGFDGKSLINPRQIELLHNLYAPTRKEVAHARLVVEAAEAAAREGLGVVSLNGKMVDSPVIERARLVLSRAELSGIREE